VPALRRPEGRDHQANRRPGGRGRLEPSWRPCSVTTWRPAGSPAPTPTRTCSSPRRAGPLRHSNWLRRVWQPACVTAGLGRMVTVEGRRSKRYEGPGFHDLRRVNATALVGEGVAVKTPQVRRGHSNPRLTLALYAQSTEAADKAAAGALGRGSSARGMNAGWPAGRGMAGAPEMPSDLGGRGGTRTPDICLVSRVVWPIR
jgi:hypothetical protein